VHCPDSRNEQLRLHVLEDEPARPGLESASYTNSSMSKVVSITTRVWSEPSAINCRVAAMPSVPGDPFTVRACEPT